MGVDVIHHGAKNGVTGSCHELNIINGFSLLIDCGLFQGNDANISQKIDFSIQSIQALIVTHSHIDHIGRIPYLLMAGFNQPIYCTDATALILPLILEDSLKLSITRRKSLIKSTLQKVTNLIQVIPYNRWHAIKTSLQNHTNIPKVTFKFKNAGHIIGSATIEINIQKTAKKDRIVFSGDLGAPYTPLLSAPKSPYQADTLILESTYGNRHHEGRKTRKQKLKSIIKTCFQNKGSLLIPAFSIGRTQELLYDIEQIIQQSQGERASSNIKWEDLDIILDSPLGTKITKIYKTLKPIWDAEARRKINAGRHPLSFEQMLIVEDNKEHQRIVQYLKTSGRPAIVIAASGMCAGGRIVNYLKNLISDPKTDVLFVGYQAQGTPGRLIRKYGPQKGWVTLDGRKYDIQAGIHSISGYSAHADQTNLIRFVNGMRSKPKNIILTHGEAKAQLVLKEKLLQKFPDINIR